MNRCPTCNNIVPRGHGHRKAKKYCNATCFHNRNLGINKDEVLKLLNKTDNVDVVAGLMGTYRQRIYSLIKRNKLQRVVVWREYGV